ncbi:hypothetical protein L0Z72_05865 [candidate division KSB1 bacterium]|nr:hypothetical protein [candidate division KSB1 bacterium]
MNLNSYEMRIIIDALEFKLAQMKKNQDMLNDSEQDRIAELSNDIYYFEFLIDRLKDDYKNRVQKIEDHYKENFGELKQMEPELLSIK